MPETTAVAPAGAPCRGCGRPCHWLDLTGAGWCQRCANAVGRLVLQRHWWIATLLGVELGPDA